MTQAHGLLAGMTAFLCIASLLISTACVSADMQIERTAFDGHGEMDPTALIAPDYEDQVVKRNLQYASFSPATCDQGAFETWKDSAYQGILINDPSFWRYQTQLQFVLSKGLALELAVAKCFNRFKLLQNFKAGKGGPIDIQNVWKAMCTDECLQSDIMHQDAMDTTGCTCMQLSTNSSEVSFRVDGDWCLHNSARQLCDTLGFCGVWGCDINDFMCPRYEWNKRAIPLKGPGHCDRSAAPAAYSFIGATVAVVVAVSTVLMVYI